MTGIKRKISVLFLAVHVTLFTFHGLNAAGYPGDYLSLFGSGIQGMYMGGAGTAMSGKSQSFYWNPAGLALQLNKEAEFFYAPLPEGSRYQSFSSAWPVSFRNTIGVSWVNLESGEAEWVDSYGIGNRGTFGDSYSALFFSWGRQLFSSVDAGLNLKVLSQSFHKWRNTGLGLDAGLLLAGNRRASLGLFFQNLVAPSFKFASDGLQDRFPTNLRIGFKFRVIPQVLVAGDYLMMDMMPYKEAYATGASTGDNRYFLGLEVSPVPFLSLGAGYNKRESGTGIRLRMRNFDFGYNWAVSGWGSSHRVGVTLRFGMLLSHQEKMLGEKAADLGEKEKAFLMREKDLMKREERADAIVGEVVARRLESAWLYVKEFKFKRAEEELWEVFRLDPENQEALKIKEGIKSGRLKADLPYAAAMQYYKNGEYRKALKNVKKALILHPEHKEAQYLEFMTRARIFLNRGEYKEAKKQALDAFKIFPDNTEVSTIIDGINDILKAKTGGE